tara:strand:- start:15251 stop:17401 length:2151 start_codon:yes stop_codon:yes gene_type:complete
MVRPNQPYKISNNIDEFDPEDGFNIDDAAKETEQLGQEAASDFITSDDIGSDNPQPEGFYETADQQYLEEAAVDTQANIQAQAESNKIRNQYNDLSTDEDLVRYLKEEKGYKNLSETFIKSVRANLDKVNIAEEFKVERVPSAGQQDKVLFGQMEQLDVLKGQLSRYGDIKAPRMADFTLQRKAAQIKKNVEARAVAEKTQGPSQKSATQSKLPELKGGQTLSQELLSKLPKEDVSMTKAYLESEIKALEADIAKTKLQMGPAQEDEALEKLIKERTSGYSPKEIALNIEDTKNIGTTIEGKPGTLGKLGEELGQEAVGNVTKGVDFTGNYAVGGSKTTSQGQRIKGKPVVTTDGMINIPKDQILTKEMPRVGGKVEAPYQSDIKNYAKEAQLKYPGLDKESAVLKLIEDKNKGLAANDPNRIRTTDRKPKVTYTPASNVEYALERASKSVDLKAAEILAENERIKQRDVEGIIKQQRIFMDEADKKIKSATFSNLDVKPRDMGMITSGPTPDELKILELKGEVGPENPRFGWQQEADRKLLKDSRIANLPRSSTTGKVLPGQIRDDYKLKQFAYEVQSAEFRTNLLKELEAKGNININAGPDTRTSGKGDFNYQTSPENQRRIAAKEARDKAKRGKYFTQGPGKSGNTLASELTGSAKETGVDLIRKGAAGLVGTAKLGKTVLNITSKTNPALSVLSMLPKKVFDDILYPKKPEA